MKEDEKGTRCKGRHHHHPILTCFPHTAILPKQPPSDIGPLHTPTGHEDHQKHTGVPNLPIVALENREEGKVNLETE